MSAVIGDSIKAFVLSRNDGTVLTSVHFNSGINESLLSSFISALWILGRKSVGQFTELSLKSNSDRHLIIASKYNLLLTVILDPPSQDYDYEFLKKDLFTFLTQLYRKSRLVKNEIMEQELKKEFHRFSKRTKTNRMFWSNLSDRLKIAEMG